MTWSVSGPAEIFDPCAELPAFEHAASVASEEKVPRSQKLNIVFRQCRSLVGIPKLQDILIMLEAEKEETDVVEVITKALKKGVRLPLSSRGFQAFQPWQSGRVRPTPCPTRGCRKATCFLNLYIYIYLIYISFFTLGF